MLRALDVWSVYLNCLRLFFNGENTCGCVSRLLIAAYGDTQCANSRGSSLWFDAYAETTLSTQQQKRNNNKQMFGIALRKNIALTFLSTLPSTEVDICGVGQGCDHCVCVLS